MMKLDALPRFSVAHLLSMYRRLRDIGTEAAPDVVLTGQATAFHISPDSSSPHSARVCRANTQASSFMKPHWGVVGAVRVLTATFALLVMTACGGGWGGITGQAPVITSQPTNLTVNPGQPATFTVTATGAATLTYQWYKNGTAISGATSNSYTNPAAVSTDSGSVYTVTVTNADGTVTSTPATLTVAAGSTTVNPDAPVITKQPASLTVNPGQPATFTVTATGAATLTYQWYENGTAISGATSNSYSQTRQRRAPIAVPSTPSL